MAEALAQGFIAKQKVDAKSIWATDISQERKKVFQHFGANASDSSSDVNLQPFSVNNFPAVLARVSHKAKPEYYQRLQVVKNTDIIFISVKPQYVSMVIKEFKQHLTEKHIIVSIAAGIPLKVLQVLLAQFYAWLMLSLSMT